MAKLIDITGQKFGKLTVICLGKRLQKYYPNGAKHGCKIYWVCECECGKQLEIVSEKIRLGHTKSCGCIRDLTSYHNRFELESVGLRALYNRYIKVSRKAKRVFELTIDQFKELTSSDCTYCGSGPSLVSTGNNKKITRAHYKYNGIDRVDSTKGYTIDNVVPCCKFCNIAKHNLTLTEFRDHITKIYNKMTETS